MKMQYAMRWMSALYSVDSHRLLLLSRRLHAANASKIPPNSIQAVDRYRTRVRKDPKNLELHRELIEYAQQSNRLANSAAHLQNRTPKATGKYRRPLRLRIHLHQRGIRNHRSRKRKNS